MFDIGWSEMMLIGIVALIVIGPNDLPGLFQKLGQFVGKARGMAREFTNAMNDAARESGVGDVKNTLNAAANPSKFGVDKLREASSSVTAATVGPATAALSEERAAEKAKFEKVAADLAKQRTVAAKRAAEATEAKPKAEAAPKSKPKAKAAAKEKPAAKPKAAAKTAAKPKAKPAPKPKSSKPKGDA
jgi:sec-independent protein translocase protein TatB